MNFLGKTFIVLILFVSIMFMVLAMAVYATHKNWRDAVEAPETGLQARLTQAQADKQRLTDQRDRLQRRLESEKAMLKQRLSQAESESDLLTQTNREIQTELDDARLSQRQAIAAAEAAQQSNTKIAEELTALRSEIRTEQSDRDKFFAIAKGATDRLQQKLGELTRAKELQQQLTAQTAQYVRRLRSLGFDPNQLSDVTPRVEGEILLVQRRDADHLIEVSIGSDDGLQRGQTVEVYRGKRYLGRAEIVRTAPDKSVGRILPRNLNGRIEVGDRVATKLRVG